MSVIVTSLPASVVKVTFPVYVLAESRSIAALLPALVSKVVVPATVITPLSVIAPTELTSKF